MRSASHQAPRLLAFFIAVVAAVACITASPASAHASTARELSAQTLKPVSLRTALSHTTTKLGPHAAPAHVLHAQADGIWVAEPGDRWWFWYASGGWPRQTWEWIGNAWYWFNADGWMQRGWQHVYGNWFHLNQSGAMDTFWYCENNEWFFLGPDGWMRRDWTYDNNTWYYLKPSGVMATGWLQTASGTYYLGNTGVMQTGWTWIEDGWYFFHPDGTLARSEEVGVGQRVDANGRWDASAPPVPTSPGSPSSPAAPQSPGSAEVPTTPLTSDIPATAATPATADAPATAVTPVTPASPVSPDTATTPASPASPTTAATPVSPESPDTAPSPSTPVLPVVAAHTVTSTEPKLLYSRTFTPKTQAEWDSTSGSYKNIAAQKIICSLAELESWGDDVVIHYTGQVPRLSFAYIPTWDDARHNDIDAYAKTVSGGWSTISGEIYSWYDWTGINPDATLSTQGEAHFPVASIREAWEKTLAKASASTTWTYTKGDGKTYPISTFSIIQPYWLPDKTTGTIPASSITSIEVTGGSQTRNVPASTPLMTREEVVRNFGVGINLSGTLECTQFTTAKQTDPFWNTTASYTTGPALWSSPAPICDLDFEVVWHNPRTTQAMLTAMKAHGIGAIRIPVSWAQHITHENGMYQIDPAWRRRVHQVVDYAYDAGLYVILNTHHEQLWLERPDLDTAYEQIKPVFRWLWGTLAEEYKDYDQRLVFEGMNEPRADGLGVSNPREWGFTELRDAIVLNKLNQDLVDAVRAASGPYNKVRILSVQAHHAGSSPQTLGSLKVPHDPYVIVAVHNYRPGDFFSPSDPSKVQSFTELHKQQIDKSFEGIQIVANSARFSLNGAPIYIGEYGFTDEGNSAARVAAIKYYTTWAKQMGIPAFYWTSCDLFDRRTLDWNPKQSAEAQELMRTWNDASIVFGSRAKEVDSRFTTPITSGVKLSYSYSNGKQGEGDTAERASIVKGGVSEPRVNLKDVEVDGKDIAIHFTGYPPVIRMADSNGWKGWIIVEPYLVLPDDADLSGYTAYWTHEQLKETWDQAVAAGTSGLAAGAKFNYFSVTTYGGSQNPDPYGPTVIGPPYLL